MLFNGAIMVIINVWCSATFQCDAYTVVGFCHHFCHFGIGQQFPVGGSRSKSGLQIDSEWTTDMWVQKIKSKNTIK